MLGIEAILAFLGLGAVVGFMAGLLGIGGGGIMVPILTSIFLWQGVAVEQVVHLALGTSMASIVITSFASLRAHHQRQGVLWDVVKQLSPGIILGTFLATFLVAFTHSLHLAIFFSLFMAYVSVQMFLDKKPKPSRQLFARGIMFFSGSVIGAISALVSIGGGSLTVPYLTWQNVALKKAIGTSAAVGFPIAIAGTLGYLLNGWDSVYPLNYTFGFIYLPAVLLISMLSFITAPLGVRMAHQLPVGKLKKIFAFLLMGLSFKMLSSILSA